jgi:hypothetical protein
LIVTTYSLPRIVNFLPAPQARPLLKLATFTLVHRGGFEPPYLLRGTDLQSVGFNHSPTCANPKTPPNRAKLNTDTAQHLSARETECENSRLTTALAGNYLEGVALELRR